jgi:hypothetical protein
MLEINQSCNLELYKLITELESFYLVSGESGEKLDGTVKASSPAWRNLTTSPPKTQETFFNLDKPVP